MAKSPIQPLIDQIGNNMPNLIKDVQALEAGLVKATEQQVALNNAIKFADYAR